MIQACIFKCMIVKTITTAFKDNCCLAVLSIWKKIRNCNLLEMNDYKDADDNFWMGITILVSITSSTSQIKLNNTPNRQKNNISQNRSYCMLLYNYSGLEIVLGMNSFILNKHTNNYILNTSDPIFNSGMNFWVFVYSFTNALL